MSRLRENPERLFDVFIEVGKPASDKDAPFILQKYPLDYSEEEVLKSVPKFAFPCDTERTAVDHFTFTLTDLDSKFRFGFCRHATGAQTCFCIISFLPWFEVFYNFLNILAEITNRSEDNDVTNMLRAAYVHEVSSSGLPVTIVADQEMFSFKAPESTKLASIPASRNLTEYYNAVDTENMMVIFASMLHERRIVVTSKKLSRLTAVVHAAAGLLYPMFWQHLFIPVLPSFLVDYLTAPMPFVIGVHSALLKKVSTVELGDVVIIDADQNIVSTEYDDLNDLPEEISSYLKRHLKGEKVKNSMQGSGDVISKTFMMALVKLIGGYRDALMFHEGETITFNPEAFVQSRPISMQPFLENMLQLQIFQQFINDRLDMLNCGRGFADVFEQECLVHADKLNAQTRYNEWLGKMKKQGKKLQRGGKDVWSDLKVKAVPAMTNAVESVKTQSKKAYSKARTKINDFNKDDDGTPKQDKSVQKASKAKSFSKEKPVSVSKERPSTIVGTPLKARRPPRPDASHDADTPERPRPQLVIRQPSTDRSRRFISHIDTEHRKSSDDSDLVYTRVSMNLIGDPDIQNAMFKSASAENLPKTNPSLQSSDSSGTITSNSSLENDTVDNSPQYKGNHSARSYTSLLNDDDSGIVMRTDSQSSLDRNKVETCVPGETGIPMHHINTETNIPPPRPPTLKSDKNLPPPRPAPRKSMSPNIAPIEDHPIQTGGISRDRPQPAHRKQPQESRMPKPYGDVLIDLDSKLPESCIGELDGMNAAGDYVLLRERKTPKTVDNSSNRRSSVSRTPAMKLGQNETPKRPSIRRERSPITPEKTPPTGSVLDFDPLIDPNSSNSTQQTATQSKGVSQQSDDMDSLLKEWDIGGLTGLSKSPQPTLSHPGYTQPTPHHRQSMNTNINRFYTPQPYIPNTRSVSTALGFQNVMPQSSTPPHLPPRAKPRHSIGGVQKSLFQTQSSVEQVNQSDPFADLVILNQSVTQQKSSSQTTSSWETFN